MNTSPLCLDEIKSEHVLHRFMWIKAEQLTAILRGMHPELSVIWVKCDAEIGEKLGYFAVKTEQGPDV